MVSSIQASGSGFHLARGLAVRGSSQISLVRGLGDGGGLSKTPEALLAGAGRPLGELAAVQEAIQSRIREEGGMELAERLAPQLVAQKMAGTLLKGRGLSLRDQSNLVAVGLKSLQVPRGAGVDFQA